MQVISLDPYLRWTSASSGMLTPGSSEHRDSFCRMLLETFNPYRPAVIDWPALSAAELERIRALPFWDTAVAIEGRAALRMDWQAGKIDDPPWPLCSVRLARNIAGPEGAVRGAL